jgi:hypothetical protein
MNVKKMNKEVCQAQMGMRRGCEKINNNKKNLEKIEMLHSCSNQWSEIRTTGLN